MLRFAAVDDEQLKMDILGARSCCSLVVVVEEEEEKQLEMKMMAGGCHR